MLTAWPRLKPRLYSRLADRQELKVTHAASVGRFDPIVIKLGRWRALPLTLVEGRYRRLRDAGAINYPSGSSYFFVVMQRD
jgi:hypothetical protein